MPLNLMISIVLGCLSRCVFKVAFFQIMMCFYSVVRTFEMMEELFSRVPKLLLNLLTRGSFNKDLSM